MGLFRLVVDVEEEEGVAAVRLHRSSWRRNGHGVGTAEFQAPAMEALGREVEEGARERDGGGWEERRRGAS